jgi:membrane-bound metal-dependent hydrolase YbcI (DUF457 family)
MIGWMVSSPLRTKKERLVVTLASILPDIDGAGILISLDHYGRYHHIFGHNIFTGLIFAVISSMLFKEKLKIFLLSFMAFNTHVVGDLLGSGAAWGIPYLWPINKTIYDFSPPFQWELDSWQNLVATALCIIGIIIIGLKKNRTIIELFSTKADGEVVAVLHKWFQRK